MEKFFDIQQGTWRVSAAENGMPLLAFIAQRLGMSRKQSKALLDRRNLFVNGRRTWMARHVLNAGDNVQLAGSSLPAQSGAVPDILFKDASILVANKPCGFTVVGAGGLETLYRAKLDCPSLCAVHRLDRDTTGCLLFAITPALKARLVRQFREMSVGKIYDVLVLNKPPFKQRTLRMALDGRSASTHVRCLRTRNGLTHIQARIETGRTHQIRRHLAAIGCPVAGDKQYGTGTEYPAEMRGIKRQMLHARRLSFTHPETNQRVSFNAPLPSDFLDCCADAKNKKIKN